MSRPALPLGAPGRSVIVPPFGSHAPSRLASRLIAQTRRCPDGYLGRRLAFALRRLALVLLGGRPVDTLTLGARFRLLPTGNVCEKRILFTPQYFDPAEREALREMARPDMHFVDIGANIGAYSLFVAALAGPDARILALEPQPGIHARLQANIALNGFAQVRALPVAVSDRAGDVTLHLNERNAGQASLRAPDGSDVAGSTPASSVTVAAVSLAGLLIAEGFERVDALKIDVEGMEDVILDAFFTQAPPGLWPTLMIIENSPEQWRLDLAALLAACGYRLTQQTRLNRIYRRS